MSIAPLAFAGLLLLAPDAGHQLSSCIWSHVPDSEKSAFVDAYHSATDNSGRSTYAFAQAFLQARDTVLMEAVSTCTNDATVPKRLARAYVTSLFMQSGSSNELARSRKIKLDDLENAWNHVPQASFDCLKAHAAVSYGIPVEKCTNVALIDPLFKSIDVDISDQVGVQQALIYFNGKAGAGWGEYLVGLYLADKAAGVLPSSKPGPSPGVH